MVAATLACRDAKLKNILVQMNLHFTLGDKPDDLDEIEWSTLR